MTLHTHAHTHKQSFLFFLGVGEVWRTYFFKIYVHILCACKYVYVITVLSTDAVTTIEENAATVQRILEDYNRMHTAPQLRKDMNYKFPEGLFNTEVDLLGSQQAYQNILTEFDNPADFTMLFDQVEADPLRPSNMFQDLSMDIFD